MYQKLRKKSSEKMSLDVGCGFITTLHSKRGMIGIDIAKSRLCDIQADGHFLPFRSNIFNEIRFWASLEHFDNPLQGMREAIRVAKNEALFHFRIPKDARHWMQELKLLILQFPFGLPYLLKTKWYSLKYSRKSKGGYYHKNMISPRDISRFFNITKCVIEKAPMPCTLGKKGWLMRRILKNPPRLGTYQVYIIEAKKKLLPKTL